MARPRKSPTRTNCAICKRDFSISAREAADKKKTCSATCSRLLNAKVRTGIKRPGVGGMTRKSATELACTICGKSFPVSPIQAHRQQKTCSRECRLKQLSKSKGGLGDGVCENCNATFKTSRYHIRRGQRFCSDECRKKWFSSQTPTGKDNPYWRGGHSGYYGPSWQEARRKVWKRDEERCRHCHKSSDELGYRPIVHHKIPFKKFGVANHEKANRIANLVCLCRSCHMIEEWKHHRRSKSC